MKPFTFHPRRDEQDLIDSIVEDLLDGKTVQGWSTEDYLARVEAKLDDTVSGAFFDLPSVSARVKAEKAKSPQHARLFTNTINVHLRALCAIQLEGVPLQSDYEDQITSYVKHAVAQGELSLSDYEYDEQQAEYDNYVDNLVDAAREDY